jgi:ssDNA-binding Zn-finger/Zn-ribbon topoisomerase 1
MNIDKCEQCGNLNIHESVTTELTRNYNKNGKCLKKDEGSVIYWMYICPKCKWISKTFTE